MRRFQQDPKRCELEPFSQQLLQWKNHGRDQVGATAHRFRKHDVGNLVCGELLGGCDEIIEATAETGS